MFQGRLQYEVSLNDCINVVVCAVTVVSMLRGPAPFMVTYMDEKLALLKSFIEPACTAVLPSCLCTTEFAWLLLMMLNLFVIFKVGTRSLYLTECD
jgi:hypothetical protein